MGFSHLGVGCCPADLSAYCDFRLYEILQYWIFRDWKTWRSGQPRPSLSDAGFPALLGRPYLDGNERKEVNYKIVNINQINPGGLIDGKEYIMQNNFLIPYREDSGVPSYLPFPRFLIPLNLSNDAKVLYAMLFDRAGISK